MEQVYHLGQHAGRFIYLATTQNCCAKKVTEHAMVNHMRTPLVHENIHMAARRLPTENNMTIFHSYRSRQYTFKKFLDHIKPYVSTCPSDVLRCVGAKHKQSPSTTHQEREDPPNGTLHKKAITDIASRIKLIYNHATFTQQWDTIPTRRQARLPEHA